MMKMTREEFIALVRISLIAWADYALRELMPGYVYAPYLDLIGQTIEDLLLGKSPGRRVINIPPRHGKSFYLIAAIAWYLGRYPDREVMLVTLSHDLSHDLASKLIKLMRSDIYRQAFPNTQISSDRAAATDFRTTQGGGFYAGSFDTRMTGRGAHFIAIDDSLSAQDARSKAKRDNVIETYDMMLSTRLNDEKIGVILAMSQRIHIDDLSRHLISQGFELLALPFFAEVVEAYPVGKDWFRRGIGEPLDPRRYPPEIAQNFQSSKAPHVWKTQYQLRPTAQDSNVMKLSYFPIIDALPSGGQTIISWDLASSIGERAAYSVGLVIQRHDDVSYLKHVIRGRFDYATLRLHALQAHVTFRPTLHLVEVPNVGKALSADLRDVGASVIEISPGSESKEGRVNTVLHKIVMHKFQLAANVPGNAAFLEEVTAFPYGSNDDQVDALSQYLNWIADPNPGTVVDPYFKVIKKRGKYDSIKRMVR
ncbi:hypothetical protein [Mesorhizobium sp.]|uniref:hypothetical protein n=1 Tax=Mesorhizobium sp. TaxID=1871066 RepID=UPI000FE57680|nr:hypothetical protein [Mesorhizobium sp.]RWH17607.1 MAG: hypothetical protein EOQ76_29580 [Mesorhizobium sp.]RWH33202.1 MAG: hypothetical protein EOQ79_30040 [Mesorhizobium sp.]TIR56284.1 MAG: hypothetical protein E5X22_28750 [Mesorhizobium sp.]TIR67168.1 MAG: hypothetical protein E5X24_21160 [Mesorhizobium sp.]